MLTVAWGVLWRFTVYLFAIQLLIQIVLSISKYIHFKYRVPSAQRELRVAQNIPFADLGQLILGLTGDNSPKKRIIEHEYIVTYVLPLISFFWVSITYLNLSLWLAVIGAVFVCLTLRFSGFFLLFRIYSDSGCGFNLYYKGWRIIGFDYHNWQVRQDPNTGKPLHPEDQYWGTALPHIDIPFWNLHHWPWQQFDDHETLEEKKKEADARRAEKLQRKMEKQERRANQLRQRQENLSNGNGVKSEELTDEIDMDSLFS